MSKLDEESLKAINMLKEKQAALNKLPRRADFEPEEVSFIKAKLGPWPRALEAAGLKEPAKKSTAERSREKRARAKKNIRRARKSIKESDV